MEHKDLAQTTVGLLGNYFQEREQLVRLRLQMLELFGESDLRDLSFDLGVNYEALPGSGTGDKCRELILHCLRRDRLDALLAACARRRPVVFDPQDYFADRKPEPAAFEVAAALYDDLEGRFRQDAFNAQTLVRLVEQPVSAGRQAALHSLLVELMAEDADLAGSLAKVLDRAPRAGDSINQQVSLSDQAQAGDINLIGKIEGDVDLKALKKKYK